ncbi:Gfo/Idh/MocA family oxidoreductase [Opitutus sp. ER46]|uniref:Gfo/Idh/MocA family protein n=1 Tax=Opitutus sp. ER46 TaxID=2161864 RepID=UPI000D2F5A4A|nr:Gfo/Idh/MocA family oxidoreductase [Opitutus sp. ER46]PTX90651.1 oxidoreductase [Opitutus sp. ER46]
MNKVRLGIIGFGGMGQFHAGNVLSGKVARCELVAACDPVPANFAQFPQVRAYASEAELLGSGEVDAVLVATPHYAHTTMGIAALNAGVHVMVEKPISVHVGDARRLLAAHEGRSRQVFAAMFNQRTDPFFQTIRRLVRTGELGEVRRVQWTITDWFRTHAYYAGDSWRATWAGEGGGVLLNQCPHNLDIFQWVFGMPNRVSGFCNYGRYHPIEVEDDVTAYFELPGGAQATFITSTGEAPGTNRLEIAAERGRLVYEAERLTWQRNDMPMSEFSRSSPERFGRPKVETVDFQIAGHGGQHVELLQNFVDAILDGTPLIAPAPEGVASVELANAILLSAWQKRTVDIPLCPEIYATELAARVKAGRRDD